MEPLDEAQGERSLVRSGRRSTQYLDSITAGSIPAQVAA